MGAHKLEQVLVFGKCVIHISCKQPCVYFTTGRVNCPLSPYEVIYIQMLNVILSDFPEFNREESGEGREFEDLMGHSLESVHVCVSACHWGRLGRRGMGP